MSVFIGISIQIKNGDKQESNELVVNTFFDTFLTDLNF